MLGRKLVERLALEGALCGQPLDHVMLVDVVEPMPVVAALRRHGGCR